MLKFNRSLLFFSVFLLVSCGAGTPPISMAGIIALVETAGESRFELVDRHSDSDGVTHSKVSYSVDGLNQFAIVLTPAVDAPAAGYPLLILNHGRVANPADYGRIDGRDARPGTYYQNYAQAYVNKGYVVVMADYRGHNDSEQQQFGLMDRVLNWYSFKMHQVYTPAYWYTRDVIGAYFAAVKLDGINPQQVYMAGHAMGAGITQRSILALGNRIKAASIWSTGRGHQEVETYWPELAVPLLIQHGEEDLLSDAKDSTTLAGILEFRGKEHQLIMVDTRDHLFSGKDFADAIERDVSWFAGHR